MKWQKFGKIFCPDNNFDWMVSHAAVPFADHIKYDLYRIYFSCRNKNDKSFTGFVDININNPKRIIYLSENPVIYPGNPGTFDDSGAMLTWIVNYKMQKYLYYIGWNLGVTVPFRNSIGLAVAKKNDIHFEKYSEGPIVDRNVVEPHFSASCCVLIESGIWKIWYLSCVKWEISEQKPKHFYHIKYAESQDGINWVRHGKVCIDFKSSDEYAISRPSVLKDDNIYKMWYSYRGRKYRIGYAESDDGMNWTRKDEEAGIDVSRQGWDSEMIEYPHVFDHKGKRYMLYNGNDYGKTGFGLAVLEDA